MKILYEYNINGKRIVYADFTKEELAKMKKDAEARKQIEDRQQLQEKH